MGCRSCFCYRFRPPFSVDLARRSGLFDFTEAVPWFCEQLCFSCWGFGWRQWFCPSHLPPLQLGGYSSIQNMVCFCSQIRQFSVYLTLLAFVV
ncbi:unnamed protein product [Arabis nemorensis]|uniref:Uncharacterized protein n=1 Tax=Arabis nemorensis TaxID=586526 RepID=A0A565CU23_9BRAS|nr:unnamed protein product [Arabis nemorensis]